MRRAWGQASVLGALELTRPSNARSKLVYTCAQQLRVGIFRQTAKNVERGIYEVYTVLDQYGNRTGVAVIGITLRAGSGGPIPTGYPSNRSSPRAKITECGTASRCRVRCGARTIEKGFFL